MVDDDPQHPLRRSRDHIIKYVDGGRVFIHRDTRNIRIVCQRCNGLLNEFQQCPGAVVCLLSVDPTRGLHKKRRRRTATARTSQRRTVTGLVPASAVPVLLPASVAPAPEYIFPADTAAKRVWNLVTLARGGA